MHFYATSVLPLDHIEVTPTKSSLPTDHATPISPACEDAKQFRGAGQGDSGGPVFINVRGGVSAAGLVSAGTTSHEVPCVGIIYKGRLCTSDLLFPWMTGTATSILSDMNLAMNTG